MPQLEIGDLFFKHRLKGVRPGLYLSMVSNHPGGDFGFCLVCPFDDFFMSKVVLLEVGFQQGGFITENLVSKTGQLFNVPLPQAVNGFFHFVVIALGGHMKMNKTGEQGVRSVYGHVLHRHHGTFEWIFIGFKAVIFHAGSPNGPSFPGGF